MKKELSKEERWLLKGQVIEIFEEFEALQYKFKRLSSKLGAYRPSYHDIKTFQENGYFVQKSINSYDLVDELMSEINITVQKIQEIDDKLEILRNKYMKIFRTDIPYQKLILDLKDNRIEQRKKWENYNILQTTT